MDVPDSLICRDKPDKHRKSCKMVQNKGFLLDDHQQLDPREPQQLLTCKTILYLREHQVQPLSFEVFLKKAEYKYSSWYL